MLVQHGLKKKEEEKRIITIHYAIKARIDSTMWTMIRGKKIFVSHSGKNKFGEEIKMV